MGCLPFSGHVQLERAEVGASDRLLAAVRTADGRNRRLERTAINGQIEVRRRIDKLFALAVVTAPHE